MKILIIGPTLAKSFSLENFYRNAFLGLGHDIHLLAVRESFSLTEKVRRRLERITYRGFPPTIGAEDILPKLDGIKPDLTIVFRGEELKPCAVIALKQQSSLGCINIYTDNPFVMPGVGASKMMDTMAQYTRLYSFSKGLVPVFEQLGAKNVKWLPFGFDPQVHAPTTECYINDKARIGYLGSWGPLQEKWVECLQDHTVNIYGHGWKHATHEGVLRSCVKPGQGIGHDMKKAVNSVEIVFNLIRAEHGCAHSMKTFEIPACGGFMISNWTEEQTEFFSDGKDCIFFHSKDELIDKINYYLKNESLRRKIAEQGLLTVQQHTYMRRAETILKDLE